MLAFYIDTPLDIDERHQVAEQLHGLGECPADVRIELKRIPHLFPAEGGDATTSTSSQHMERLLRHAGVLYGPRSIFIMPAQPSKWVSLLLLCFSRVSGQHPILVQPWFENAKGESVRRAWLNVVNLNHLELPHPASL